VDVGVSAVIAIYYPECGRISVEDVLVADGDGDAVTLADIIRSYGSDLVRLFQAKSPLGEIGNMERKVSCLR
jgi:hypothetical protein